MLSSTPRQMRSTRVTQRGLAPQRSQPTSPMTVGSVGLDFSAILSAERNDITPLSIHHVIFAGLTLFFGLQQLEDSIKLGLVAVLGVHDLCG